MIIFQYKEGKRPKVIVSSIGNSHRKARIYFTIAVILHDGLKTAKKSFQQTANDDPVDP
jgi:hypothetical protein